MVFKLLQNDSWNFNHSLPVVVEKELELDFREYQWGDDLVKSRLFDIYEPREDKKLVQP